jgi:hypothetical protein
MADRTRRADPARLVAADATCHRGYGGRFRHDLQVTDVPMTRLALNAGLQMLAMGPGNSRQHLVDTYPGDRLLRPGVLRKLLDRGPASDHRGVAAHAGGGSRQRHLIARRRVGMTEQALQTHADMGLVTVRQGLFRGWVRSQVFSDSRRRRGSRRRTVCMNSTDHEQHEGGSDHRNHVEKFRHGDSLAPLECC